MHLLCVSVVCICRVYLLCVSVHFVAVCNCEYIEEEEERVEEEKERRKEATLLCSNEYPTIGGLGAIRVAIRVIKKSKECSNKNSKSNNNTHEKPKCSTLKL